MQLCLIGPIGIHAGAGGNIVIYFILNSNIYSESLFIDIGISQVIVNLPPQGKLPENLLVFSCR